MASEKVTNIVTPAKAGVYNLLKILDSGFRRNDKKDRFQTFYEFIKMHSNFYYRLRSLRKNVQQSQ